MRLYACLLFTPERWRKFYRWVGIAMTLLNWATLIAVHALLSGTEIQGLDGPRCKFTFEMVSFRMKWLGQFFNQVFQVKALVRCVVRGRAHEVLEGGSLLPFFSVVSASLQDHRSTSHDLGRHHHQQEQRSAFLLRQ